MAREDYLLTVDVGSSRIIGALIKRGSPKNEVVYISSRDVPFQESLQLPRYTETIITSLDDCLRDISTHISTRLPGLVLCTLSSLMYEAGLATHHQKFSNETLITPDIINKTKTEGNAVSDRMVLENAIIQIKLNGYTTVRPVGKLAHSVDTAVYKSTAETEYVKKIKEKISKHFHSVPTEIHSFSFAAFTVLRDMIHEENFVCLDFGGEITDIIIVKKGVLEKTISIPFGKNTIIRELMKEMKVSYEIAESSLRLYHDKKSSVDITNNMAQALETCKQHWDTLFLGTLEHVTLDSLLPQDVHVLSHSSVMPIVSFYLQAERYNRYVFVGQPFRVHEINEKTLGSFFQTTEKSTFVDPFIVISSLFSDTLKHVM